MRFQLLTTRKEFENLKKGDRLLIRWSDYFVRHTQGAKEIMLYNIAEILENNHEIICQKRYNHYFNYNCFLEGRSNALKIYKVEPLDLIKGF